jgi:hypothetical protein
LHRLLLGPAAVDHAALEYDAISAVTRSGRDPVDGIASADPFSDHGTSSFAQAGERRSGGVR